MGCTRCGTDSKLIELMFNKLMHEALNDGTLQAGLVDCAEKRLEKNTNVLTCAMLEDAVCELFTEGKICINEPVTIHFDPATGKLSLGMKNGEVLETTLNFDDQNTKNSRFELTGNKLKLVDSDGNAVEVDLSKYQNDGNTKNASLTLNARNELVLRDSEGNEVKTALGGLATKIVAGAGINYNAGTGALSVKTDGKTLRTNAQGQLEVIPAGCIAITDLNDLPFTDNGMYCIYGNQNALNLPSRSTGTETHVPRSATGRTDEGFDWVGYVVRTNTEAIVYVRAENVTWSSMNDGNVAAGAKTPTTGWTTWARVENTAMPSNSIQVTNAFGDRTLFYASATE